MVPAALRERLSRLSAAAPLYVVGGAVREEEGHETADEEAWPAGWDNNKNYIVPSI